jgi:hypothetical protein
LLLFFFLSFWYQVSSCVEKEPLSMRDI